MAQKKKYHAAGEAFRRSLDAHMKAADVSQRRLAQKTGVSQAQIGNILRGIHSPSIETASTLAAAFDMTVWDMMIAPKDLDRTDTVRLAKVIDGFVKGSARDRAIIETVADSTGKFRALG